MTDPAHIHLLIPSQLVSINKNICEESHFTFRNFHTISFFNMIMFLGWGSSVSYTHLLRIYHVNNFLNIVQCFQLKHKTFRPLLPFCCISFCSLSLLKFVSSKSLSFTYTFYDNINFSFLP